jgi:hypothetical protein
MWCEGGLVVSEHYEQFEIPESRKRAPIPLPSLHHRVTRMEEARRIFSHLPYAEGPEE